MRRCRVVFRQSAQDNLGEIYDYVRQQSGLGETAKAYLQRIRIRCNRIGNVPFGGARRDDLGPGMRMTVFERRIIILYRVDNDTVWITNIFSGGRDYETLFDRRRDIPADDPG